MDLLDQLRTLTSRVQNELSRGSNYYKNSKVVWRSVEKFIAKGGEISTENIDTGDKTESPTLADLAQDYVAGYVAESVFQLYDSLFEEYIFGLIGFWLMVYLKGIVGLDDDESDDKVKKAEKSVPLFLVIDNSDRDSILRAIVERELDHSKYR